MVIPNKLLIWWCAFCDSKFLVPCQTKIQTMTCMCAYCPPQSCPYCMREFDRVLSPAHLSQHEKETDSHHVKLTSVSMGWQKHRWQTKREEGREHRRRRWCRPEINHRYRRNSEHEWKQNILYRVTLWTCLRMTWKGISTDSAHFPRVANDFSRKDFLNVQAKIQTLHGTFHWTAW